MARETEPRMRGILLLLAVIAGTGIANIYYNQPLLDALRVDFPRDASWVGLVADKRGPRAVVSFSILLIAAAFVIFGFSGASLIGLVLGVVVLDIGLQCSQVSNQARIFALNPGARSRMNTVYMTAFFIGGAIGSAAGAYVWQRFGWVSACIVGGLFTVLAWLNHQRPWRRPSSPA